MGLRVKITGSEGFIGSLLCEKLNVPKENRIDIVNCDDHDVRVESNRRTIVQDCDVLIHLAGLTGFQQCQSWQESHKMNGHVTKELAKLHKEAGGKKFIFASTSAVYGEATSYVMREEDPCSPRSNYGRSKHIGEEVMTLKDEDYEVIIFRKSNVYGQSINNKGINAIDKFIDSYLNKEKLQIQGNGEQKRDFVHILDVVSAYADVATQKVRSGIYNIGGTENITIAELAKLVNKIGYAVFRYKVRIDKGNDNSSASLNHDFIYDHSKARMEWVYKPIFALDDYIKERMGRHLRKE